MFESLGRFVHRGRWTLLVLSVAAAVLVAPFGLEVFGRMADGGFEDPAAESTTSATWNDDWYSGDSPDVVVLYTHPTVSARDRRYKKAVHDSLRRLPAIHVRRMTTYWTTHSAKMISRDSRSTYALITLKGDKQRAYAAIERRLRTVEGLTVKIGGAVPLLDDLNTQTGADLARAEAISMPVLLVLLVLVFGSLVAAGLPLLVGLLSVLGALVLLRLLTEVTEVSVFSLNVVTMLGLGLAIDYSLFVLSAFREEIRRGASTEAAVVATMATAGRTVAFSGLTVATALLGLLLFPQMFLRSIGLGAAAVVLVAMAAALVVLPAVLGILGPRVDALRLTPSFGGPRNGGAWHAVASSVMRTPLLYLVGVTAVLISLALPFVDVQFGNVDHRVLPARVESRQVAEAIDTSFAKNSMAAIDVHVLVERDFQENDPLLPGPLGQGHTVVSPVTPVLPTDVKPFTDRLRRLPGVTGVDVTGFSQTNGAVRLAVRYEGDPMSPSARSLVTLIRAMAPEPNVRSVVVGGPTAAQMDLIASLTATLPWMVLVVCGATFVLLFAAFGSLLLPLKALLMNVLSIGASFGVIVWAFQYGNLATLLGFTPTGTIEATVTVLILAVVFGLSMDYELFLLSRVRAEWLRTGDNTAAVAAGLQKTGGIITSAALLLLVVIGAFSTAGITIVKLLGVGMFVAIVVDATLVRALLVPATMRLMGAANWWLPGPLRGLHRRIELREHAADDPAKAPPTQSASPALSASPARPASSTRSVSRVRSEPVPAPHPVTAPAPAPAPPPVTAPRSTAALPMPPAPASPSAPASAPLAAPAPSPAPNPLSAPAPAPLVEPASSPAPVSLPVPTPAPLAAPAPPPASAAPFAAPAALPVSEPAPAVVSRERVEAAASTRRVVRPNLDGPGWQWADEDERRPAPAVRLPAGPAPVRPLDTDLGPVLDRGSLFGADTDPVAPAFATPHPAPAEPVNGRAEPVNGRSVRRRRGLNPYPGTTAPRRPRREPSREQSSREQPAREQSSREQPARGQPAREQPSQGQEAREQGGAAPEPRLTWVKVRPRTRVVRADPDGPGWSWQEVDG
ncbi:MMPL family transporter [Nonomuraea mangrovi]|uniref:MMPL family transporter n=1 Tax=Nonomuraea mangrovi TaxID=2316207 RepID=A0ABW4TE73_9ACTN